MDFRCIRIGSDNFKCVCFPFKMFEMFLICKGYYIMQLQSIICCCFKCLSNPTDWSSLSFNTSKSYVSVLRITTTEIRCVWCTNQLQTQIPRGITHKFICIYLPRRPEYTLKRCFVVYVNVFTVYNLNISFLIRNFKIKYLLLGCEFLYGCWFLFFGMCVQKTIAKCQYMRKVHAARCHLYVYVSSILLLAMIFWETNFIHLHVTFQ